MALTRKHFEQAAATVKALFMSDAPTAEGIREQYVKIFSEANPRFDVTRFRNACAPDVVIPKARKRTKVAA